jgi:ribosomal RNA methyltransferase Nop2
MGRKARNKQAPPAPLPGSDLDKRSGKGKKKSSAAADAAKPFKAAGGKAAQAKPAARKPRVKAVDRVDEDSDDEEALKQG